MPKVDINEIERAVQENIKDRDKAARVMADLRDLVRRAENKKARKGHKPEKNFVHLITSEKENADSTMTLIDYVGESLEDLVQQNPSRMQVLTSPPRHV